jgi:hemoglobin-like flavoprotein
MALQIELLETSFQEIAPQGEAFVTKFYETLFARFPQTKGFFTSTDMKEQKKKLLGALALVIQNLRKPDVLAAALKGLGQRHEAYGVQPEHYTPLWERFCWIPLRPSWETAGRPNCSMRGPRHIKLSVR